MYIGHTEDVKRAELSIAIMERALEPYGKFIRDSCHPDNMRRAISEELDRMTQAVGSPDALYGIYRRNQQTKQRRNYKAEFEALQKDYLRLQAILSELTKSEAVVA